MDLIRAHRDQILRLATLHGARNVRVFGSFARGDAQPESDVDLLIDLDPARSLLDRIALKQDLEDLLGRRVDVLAPANLHALIRERVLREAVSL
jgi:uncharacterized protein